MKMRLFILFTGICGSAFKKGNYSLDVEASCMKTQIIFFRVQRKTIVAEGIENKECDNQKIRLVLVFLISFFCILVVAELSF